MVGQPDDLVSPIEMDALAVSLQRVNFQKHGLWRLAASDAACRDRIDGKMNVLPCARSQSPCMRI